jgi:hypothetical protein
MDADRLGRSVRGLAPGGLRDRSGKVRTQTVARVQDRAALRPANRGNLRSCRGSPQRQVLTGYEPDAGHRANSRRSPCSWRSGRDIRAGAGLCHKVVRSRHVSNLDPLNDTVNLCRKLISALGPTLGGRSRRRNASSNQGFLIRVQILWPRLARPKATPALAESDDKQAIENTVVQALTSSGSSLTDLCLSVPCLCLSVFLADSVARALSRAV